MRRLLLILSSAALAWAALVVVTGGIQFRLAGALFRSRDPGRALTIGLVLLLLHAALFRESLARDGDRVAASLRRLLPVFALCCALVLGWHAIHFGTFTAGGSDSSGYVTQAYGWAKGAMFRPQPLPMSVPWPSGDASLIPLGYSQTPEPHTMAPIYAPGLPLMMAGALVFGSCGPFLVVPMCAAAAVWLTFLLGRRTAGPWAGVLAALFVATSPIVLFQSLTPMSDIPSAAFWTGAAVAVLGSSRRSTLVSGLCAGAGLLVRPNLPILTLVLLAHLALTSRGRERWIRMVLFSAGVAPAVLFIAVLYTGWHGGPTNSGFGGASEIFSLGKIVPNLTRYPVWLWQSQSPFVLLALVPLLPWFKSGTNGAAVRLCAALFLATLCSYLVYFNFEEWWYLRFLLPAIPAVLVLLSAGLLGIGRRLARPWGHVAVTAVAILLLAHTAGFNNGHGMFGPLKEGERRYADVGAYIHQALPRNAVILSVQHSGSVRHYTGLMTIRWDLIDREWTGRAAGELERLGLHPYMVIEDWELPLLHEWFSLGPGASLPWPLVARMKEHGGVSILDLSRTAPATPVPAAIQSGAAPHCVAQPPLTIQQQ